MTMTDPPSGITKFDDFVHTTYIYKLKVPLKKMLILKFIICKKASKGINQMLMECGRFGKHYLLMCLINIRPFNRKELGKGVISLG